MRRGRLYVLEGPDGVGKSTLSNALTAYLREEGTPVRSCASPGRERGTLGYLVWKLHHRPDHLGVERLDPTSLQLLHVAAHVDALENQIRPALQEGETVVLDRFWWSTLIYGTTFGIDRESIDMMLSLEQRHWEGITPDVIFVVDREQPLREDSTPLLFSKIREEYLKLASATPNAVLIDNSDTVASSLEQIAAAVCDQRSRRCPSY